MKKVLKSKNTIIVLAAVGCIAGSILSTGCAESKKIAAKSGVELWAENCQRCHNTPSATAFSAEQWKTIGMHMQTRALLTTTERDKIVDFLQAGSKN